MKQIEYFDSLDYHNNSNFLELSIEDRKTFEDLYKILLRGPSHDSNECIANLLHVPKSTLEKKLNRFEKNHLIVRECKREKRNNIYITVDRILQLDPKNFPFDYTSFTHKVFCDYIYYQSVSTKLYNILEMEHDKFKEYARSQKNNDNL